MLINSVGEIVCGSISGGSTEAWWGFCYSLACVDCSLYNFTKVPELRGIKLINGTFLLLKDEERV